MNLTRQGPMDDDGRSAYQPGRLWLRLRSNGSSRGKAPLPPEERERRRQERNRKHVEKRRQQRAERRAAQSREHQPGWCLSCRTARATAGKPLCETCTRAVRQVIPDQREIRRQLSAPYRGGVDRKHEQRVQTLQTLQERLPL